MLTERLLLRDLLLYFQYIATVEKVPTLSHGWQGLCLCQVLPACARSLRHFLESPYSGLHQESQIWMVVHTAPSGRKGTCMYKHQPRAGPGSSSSASRWMPSPLWAPDAGNHFLALWWECENVHKNAFMDCFVCKCLLSDTPQGFIGQVANVHQQPWEFPSTEAVLPFFVIPQRTSWSIAWDPYLTLLPACSVSVPHGNRCQSPRRQRS